jgi:hypothetical protein
MRKDTEIQTLEDIYKECKGGQEELRLACRRRLKPAPARIDLHPWG